MLYDSLVGGAVVCFICHALLYADVVSHVSAKDSLAPGEALSIFMEEFLESPNTEYRLKFIERSSRWYYLCIQSTRYHFEPTPEYITIWVGWHGQSRYFAPSLLMSEDGQLEIDDFIVNIKQPSYVKNTTATLLDTGNLVLRSAGGRTLWQSFDYPNNTWVQGMKLGWFGLKTQRPHQRFLTSWTSDHNPSPGAFTFGVDPNNTKQLVLMRRGIVYWQSGVWNGTAFPFLGGLHFSYFSDENQSYFVLNEGFHFNSTYMSLLSSGEVIVEQIGDDESSLMSAIHCYSSEMSYLNDLGCVRVKKSNCSVGDGFNSTTGLIDKWEQYFYNSTFGITDCNEMCAKNCSCNAYAAINADDGTGCKFSSSPAYRYISNAETLYIRNNAKPGMHSLSFTCSFNCSAHKFYLLTQLLCIQLY